HGEGNIEDARERLRQQRLAGAGRTDQQDVRFCELDIVVLGLMIEPLVVIVDPDREHLLGVILTDHVIVEDLANLLGSWNAIARLHQRGFILLADDVHAQFDTLVADEYSRTGDELAHLVLALAAERAVERILRFAAADLAHLSTPTRCKSSQPQPRWPNQSHTIGASPSINRGSFWVSLTGSDASASLAPWPRSGGCARASPRTAGRPLPACGLCSCRCRSAYGLYAPRAA